MAVHYQVNVNHMTFSQIMVRHFGRFSIINYRFTDAFKKTDLRSFADPFLINVLNLTELS